jgi:large subunit ribosomal protein L4
MATKATKTKEVKEPKAAKPKVEKAEKKVVSLSVPVFTQDGKEAGTIELPSKVFGAPWRADLVHQVFVGMEGNARMQTADTKNRGEVRGGGRKPWKQKGTGRARHGSSRSPIWRGGGITFGPRAEKKYERTIPKRMRAEALASVLSRKLRDGEILFVDSISLKAPKTADAVKIMTALAKVKGFNRLDTKRKNAALFLLGGHNDIVLKSFRNIGSVSVDEARNLNVVTALKNAYLVVEKPKEAVAFFASRFEK